MPGGPNVAEMQFRWIREPEILAERYKLDSNLTILLKIHAAALVIEYGLNAENAQEWIEGELMEFRRECSRNHPRKSRKKTRPRPRPNQ